MLFHHEFLSVSGWLYLDPGSGSLILQVVMAAVLGLGVATKLFWGKIKMRFTQKESDRTETNENEDGD
jgi:hypothetical protein